MYIVFESSGFLRKNLISYLKKKHGINKIICINYFKNFHFTSLEKGLRKTIDVF